jgi:hypothetical protein
VKVEGMDELLAALQALPEGLQKRVMRAWTLRQARAAARAAQAAAPRGPTGNLKKGIVARSSGSAKLQKTGSLARAVAIGKAPAYHFHWVNRGISSPRFTKKGANRGTMRGNPFFQQATQPIISAAQADVSNGLAREVQALLDKAVRRTTKRGAT